MLRKCLHRHTGARVELQAAAALTAADAGLGKKKFKIIVLAQSSLSSKILIFRQVVLLIWSMHVIPLVWTKPNVFMFSYDKCNLNTDLPAVPRFRIDDFCLNKDSAISLDVLIFLQLAIKLVTDYKSWFCRRKIQQIFEANTVHIFNVHFFKYVHLSCCVIE